jgi:DNA-binding transcriptional regulator GbsR (MarR family)
MPRQTKKQAAKEAERQRIWQQIEALGKISKECPSDEAQEHIEQAIKTLIDYTHIFHIEG